jgi:O-antigen ligase
VRWALIAATIGSYTSPPLTNIAAALALLLALASAPMRASLVEVARQPLGRSALALCAVMAVAMLWAGVPWPQRFAAWWNWRTMLLLVLTAAAFRDPRWKERFSLTLVAVVTAAAIVSWAMWSVHRTLEPPYAGTVLLNHVTQSMALATAILLAVVLAAQRGRSAPMRWLLAAAALVCLSDLVVVTEGRSGQVALAVAALSAALLMLKGARRWQVVLALPLLAAALVAVSPPLQQRFVLVARQAQTLDCSSREESSTALRLLLWRTTAVLIRAHPWFGYGVGGFTPAYDGEVRNQIGHQALQNWCARPAHDPHNQFLRVTVEAGVLGLVAFLGLIAGALRQQATQPYRGCALALLAAWCTTSLFNSHFQTFNEAHLIVLLLGALLAPDLPQRKVQEAARAASSASATAERTCS